MNKSTKKPAKKRATRKRPAVARSYVMPKSAAELGISCAECGAPAEWFDYERGERDHRRGFICGAHARSANSEKLLVREQGSSQVA
jgi:hypothetical protein